MDETKDQKPSFIYQIRLYPDPILHTYCVPVETKDMTDEFKTILQGVFPLLGNQNCYAIAANQIGLTKRFFVMHGHVAGKIICINPTIIKAQGEVRAPEECLSIPTVNAKIFRANEVTFQYRDLDWKLCDMTLSGMEARVIQHEIDHLDGILLISRLTLASRSYAQAALNALEKSYNMQLRIEAAQKKIEKPAKKLDNLATTPQSGA